MSQLCVIDLKKYTEETTIYKLPPCLRVKTIYHSQMATPHDGLQIREALLSSAAGPIYMYKATNIIECVTPEYGQRKTTRFSR